MHFPTARCTDPVCGEVSISLLCRGAFILCRRIVYLLLMSWRVISVITPTSAQHGPIQGSPGGSHAVATPANVQASEDPTEQSQPGEDH